jgi:hypothetical protein
MMSWPISGTQLSRPKRYADSSILTLTFTTQRELMTDAIHDTAVKVDVYPDEFFPLLKVINCAILMPERFALTAKELDAIIAFQRDFTDTAYEYGVN